MAGNKEEKEIGGIEGRGVVFMTDEEIDAKIAKFEADLKEFDGTHKTVMQDMIDFVRVVSKERDIYRRLLEQAQRMNPKDLRYYDMLCAAD